MTTSPPNRASRAGITLLETMFALVLVSLVAALVLPWTVPGRSGAALGIDALRVAALLRFDRDAALRTGRAVATAVDPGAGMLRSGAGGGTVDLPGVTLGVAGRAPIVFAPDGRSSGAVVSLRRGARTVAVTVNALTAAVTLGGA